MSMTKKDYELIANAVYKQVLEIKDDVMLDSYESDLIVIKSTASHLAHSLQLDNPKFDIRRFLKACGAA